MLLWCQRVQIILKTVAMEMWKYYPLPGKTFIPQKDPWKLTLKIVIKFKNILKLPLTMWKHRNIFFSTKKSEILILILNNYCMVGKDTTIWVGLIHTVLSVCPSIIDLKFHGHSKMFNWHTSSKNHVLYVCNLKLKMAPYYV